MALASAALPRHGVGHELPVLAADFVLVWETVPQELSGQQDSRENGDMQERSATIHRTWRKKFLDELHTAGIHMEKVPGDLISNFYPR